MRDEPSFEKGDLVRTFPKDIGEIGTVVEISVENLSSNSWVPSDFCKVAWPSGKITKEWCFYLRKLEDK